MPSKDLELSDMEGFLKNRDLELVTDTLAHLLKTGLTMDMIVTLIEHEIRNNKPKASRKEISDIIDEILGLGNVIKSRQSSATKKEVDTYEKHLGSKTITIKSPIDSIFA